MVIYDYKIILKLLYCIKKGIVTKNAISLALNVPVYRINEIIKQIMNDGYLNLENNVLRVDPLSIIIYLIRHGVDIEEFCGVIEWNDFEEFIKKILEEYGFRTLRSFRLKKPRLEVDILALKKDFGLVVDCKQWRKTLSPSALNSIVMKQVERAKIILLKEKVLLQNKFLVPIVVTLYPQPTKFVDGVPIVPVERFKSFVSEVDGRLSEFLKVYFKDDKIFTKI
ncbi:MAG: restriction endonuclease [Nitrososphaeria archaeon]